MFDGSFESLAQQALVGFLLLLVGMVNFALAYRSAPLRLSIASLIVMGSCFGASLFLNQWKAPAAIAGLFLASLSLLEFFRSGLFEKFLSWIAPVCLTPRALAMSMSASGLVVIFGSVFYHEYVFEQKTDADLATMTLESLSPELQELTEQEAKTDKGSSIHLKIPTASTLSRDIEQSEKQFLDRATFKNQLIRRGEANFNCNCHGWVYTGGKFWVIGSQVDAILKENGYTVTSEPSVGDLIIYRDEQGQPAHTGVVRYTTQGQPILIESKWGSLGVFLHQVKDCPYGQSHQFYRSSRQGHLLKNLPTEVVASN